jgi:hypothetical protein
MSFGGRYIDGTVLIVRLVVPPEDVDGGGSVGFDDSADSTLPAIEEYPHQMIAPPPQSTTKSSETVPNTSSIAPPPLDRRGGA